ncbi:glutathione S-transferase [Iodidimonas muriae]|uniref:Glutathione S-transferase n=1 Tax=Iodidimonas muriae TaxID=261467 RepID=A0ABQ2LAT6_9PROT|nr:glutathione S-transferase family protein [Iodidimonas muriae]GER08093.1 glutathione S-transferase [Kordiimonadales bacterium JCM 17843]GGO08876.1 glutathione S-transferase [Iodidimonas muriae]
MMKLYGRRLSPYFERVVLVLSLKNALDDVALTPVPGGLGSEDYKAITPIGKIPTLEVREGFVIPEGQVICTYLERLYPSPALIPDGAEDAAQVELLCRLVDIYVSAALGPVFRAVREGEAQSDAANEAVANLQKALSYLEYYITPGQRAVGDHWSLADCAMIPVFFFVRTLAPILGFDPFEGTPKLKQWHDVVAQTDLCKQSNEEQGKSLADFMAQSRN